MTQLILDGIVLPESVRGGYNAAKEELSVERVMINGRMVKELRGSVWVLRYQYGYFDTETKNRLISACERGKKTPIRCGFLTPDSAGELRYSNFFVTAFQYPKFMWSKSVSGKEPVPLWGDFSVQLREVKPSD
jgi:hypothetical protein